MILIEKQVTSDYMLNIYLFSYAIII